MEKKCFKCNVVKPLSEYYKHKMMGDGHLNKCKDCTKSDVKKRSDVLSEDPEWVKSEQKRGREKYHRLGYLGKHKPSKETSYLATKSNRSKFPEKYKARTAANRMSSINGHNHHWSYNKEHWRDVIDIDLKSHAKAHRFIVYDQERMMYRDLEGKLLDTRERHLEYILRMIETEDD